MDEVKRLDVRDRADVVADSPVLCISKDDAALLQAVVDACNNDDFIAIDVAMDALDKRLREKERSTR